MPKLTKPSEGYFLAKREMQEAFGRRLEILEKKRYEAFHANDIEEFVAVISKIKQLEECLSYVRNVMLWDTSKGK